MLDTGWHHAQWQVQGWVWNVTNGITFSEWNEVSFPVIKMQHQGTVSTLMLAGIAWLVLKECYFYLSAVPKDMVIPLQYQVC